MFYLGVPCLLDNDPRWLDIEAPVNHLQFHNIEMRKAKVS